MAFLGVIIIATIFRNSRLTASLICIIYLSGLVIILLFITRLARNLRTKPFWASFLILPLFGVINSILPQTLYQYDLTLLLATNNYLLVIIFLFFVLVLVLVILGLIYSWQQTQRRLKGNF